MLAMLKIRIPQFATDIMKLRRNLLAASIRHSQRPAEFGAFRVMCTCMCTELHLFNIATIYFNTPVVITYARL